MKELAKISGVSVRTLHWYDEIGLLKPAYIGANGYRYYEQEQLLLLQQILFFRELDFKLDDVQQMITSCDFDKIKTLLAHKSNLQLNQDRMSKLIQTIDKTVVHLKGNKMINEHELYEGFDLAKQKEYEQYLVKHHGTIAEDLIAQCNKRTVSWGSQEWKEIKEEGASILQGLSVYIEKGAGPRDEEVQHLIQQHYKMIGRFYDLTKDIYLSLAQLYCEHPGFRKFFEEHSQQLPEFMAEAMRVYIYKDL